MSPTKAKLALAPPTRHGQVWTFLVSALLINVSVAETFAPQHCEEISHFSSSKRRQQHSENSALVPVVSAFPALLQQ
jgi:hypothetical protein